MAAANASSSPRTRARTPRGLTAKALILDQLPHGARLNADDVGSLLGVSRSGLDLRLKAGRAPAPLQNEFVLTWRAGDVRAWLNGDQVFIKHGQRLLAERRANTGERNA